MSRKKEMARWGVELWERPLMRVFHMKELGCGWWEKRSMAWLMSP